jgi:hypothetical protein
MITSDIINSITRHRKLVLSVESTRSSSLGTFDTAADTVVVHGVRGSS